MLIDFLHEIAKYSEDIASNALAGLYVSLIWAMLVWAYLERRDRRHQRTLRQELQYPSPREIGCGKDMFLMAISNPIEKPVTITAVTLTMADPKHSIMVHDPEKPMNPPTPQPCPMIIPLCCHGRDFNPLQPEPPIECNDPPRVTLYPTESHKWWVTNMKDNDNYFLPHMIVVDLAIEIQYEQLTGRPVITTIHANKQCLAHIQGLFESYRAKT